MVEKQKAVVENGVQKIRITAEKGYSPKEFQLQKGIPAEITFHRVNPSGCYKEILFEDQGILEPLEVGVDKVISLLRQNRELRVFMWNEDAKGFLHGCGKTAVVS